MSLIFGSSSSDLWVNPSIYKPSASSTAKKTGKTFRVAYGDGSHATGDIYLESVTVGGLTAVKQAFGTATKSTLHDSGNQGIAGMAFKSIAQFNADPFFDTLVKQGTAPQNVFAFGLWPEGARLDLGHIATEAYQGEITYSKSLGVETQVQNGEVYGVYPTSSPPSITLTFNGPRHELLQYTYISSSDLWVNPSIYKPSASSTAKKTGKTFRVAYGDGSHATGDIYLESVTVGGLTAVKQAFGTATKVCNDHGCWHLRTRLCADPATHYIASPEAFKSIAQFNADPFFDTLVKQGTAPQNVFAFGLWPEGARLDLGHIATEAYQGEITYSKVDPSDGQASSTPVSGSRGRIICSDITLTFNGWGGSEEPCLPP
ncbi:unnamed protein product [Tilletia controversa]|nr:unnamed protein product [Tilletia controversa]